MSAPKKKTSFRDRFRKKSNSASNNEPEPDVHPDEDDIDDDDEDLSSPAAFSEMPNPMRKSLSAKLRDAVHDYKEVTPTHNQPDSAKEEMPDVDPNDPRLSSLARTGSFQVLEGGVRVSQKLQTIEVPSMWVTTDADDS
eukprot:c39109_g1_i1.p1 GENE.c39109_g1_i1~~c39109_g1_i1.p1  ORF type:complete len:147 (+),score=33.72 c39109_g1_i1:27-443(+)